LGGKDRPPTHTKWRECGRRADRWEGAAAVSCPPTRLGQSRPGTTPVRAAQEGGERGVGAAEAAAEQRRAEVTRRARNGPRARAGWARIVGSVGRCHPTQSRARLVTGSLTGFEKGSGEGAGPVRKRSVRRGAGLFFEDARLSGGWSARAASGVDMETRCSTRLCVQLSKTRVVGVESRRSGRAPAPDLSASD